MINTAIIVTTNTIYLKKIYTCIYVWLELMIVGMYIILSTKLRLFLVGGVAYARPSRQPVHPPMIVYSRLGGVVNN